MERISTKDFCITFGDTEIVSMLSISFKYHRSVPPELESRMGDNPRRIQILHYINHLNDALLLRSIECTDSNLVTTIVRIFLSDY